MARCKLVSAAIAGSVGLALLCGCTKYEDRMLGNLAGGPLKRDWKSLALAYEKEKNVQVLNLGAAPDQSSHLLVIPTSLASQVNPGNDLTLTILRGRGIAKVKGEEMHVRKGAVIFVPRGDVFEYVNKSKKPTLALGLFSPPFEEAGTNRPDTITPPSKPLR
jgi:mannose-6-phosphate isomerase-like protein (cupin superfamily)